jgi:hypothetical protein
MEPGNLSNPFESSPWRLYFGRRSGLRIPESKMLEDLLDDLIIIYKTDNLHPPLAFEQLKGLTL